METKSGSELSPYRRLSHVLSKIHNGCRPRSEDQSTFRREGSLSNRNSTCRLTHCDSITRQQFNITTKSTSPAITSITSSSSSPSLSNHNTAYPSLIQSERIRIQQAHGPTGTPNHDIALMERYILLQIIYRHLTCTYLPSFTPYIPLPLSISPDSNKLWESTKPLRHVICPIKYPPKCCTFIDTTRCYNSSLSLLRLLIDVHPDLVDITNQSVKGPYGSVYQQVDINFNDSVLVPTSIEQRMIKERTSHKHNPNLSRMATSIISRTKTMRKKHYTNPNAYVVQSAPTLLWTDRRVTQSLDFYSRIPLLGRIKTNHFACVIEVTSKSELTRRIGKMQSLFPHLYDFYPASWVLPAHTERFQRAYFAEEQAYRAKLTVWTSKRGKAQRTRFGEIGDSMVKPLINASICDSMPIEPIYILKPNVGSHGTNIKLVRTLQEVYLHSTDIRGAESSTRSSTKRNAMIEPGVTIQRYISSPALLNGHKCDFRIYVLIQSLDPFTVFVYRQGLARLATETYHPPNKSNIDKTFMHITNYAMNKNNDKFVKVMYDETNLGKSGSKRLLSDALQQMIDSGIPITQEAFWKQVDLIVGLTLVALWPPLFSAMKVCYPQWPSLQRRELDSSIGTFKRPCVSKMPSANSSPCFQILGFDLLLDSFGKLWLIEVNGQPDLHIDNPLDLAVKSDFLDKSFVECNIVQPLRTDKIETTQEEKSTMETNGLISISSNVTSLRPLPSIKSSLHNIHIENNEQTAPYLAFWKNSDVESIFIAYGNQHNELSSAGKIVDAPQSPLLVSVDGYARACADALSTLAICDPQSDRVLKILRMCKSFTRQTQIEKIFVRGDACRVHLELTRYKLIKAMDFHLFIEGLISLSSVIHACSQSASITLYDVFQLVVKLLITHLMNITEQTNAGLLPNELLLSSSGTDSLTVHS